MLLPLILLLLLLLLLLVMVMVVVLLFTDKRIHVRRQKSGHSALDTPISLEYHQHACSLRESISRHFGSLSSST